jgi:hypothetical protein
MGFESLALKTLKANCAENLEVKPEEEVDTDQKGPYILHSEIRVKKSAGDDDVPVDVLQLLGEDALKLMTQLINNI